LKEGESMTVHPDLWKVHPAGNPQSSSGICGGCNVEWPRDHNCTGENAIVDGRKTGKPCTCMDCREMENLQNDLQLN
jgi:hypothetical protein